MNVAQVNDARTLRQPPEFDMQSFLLDVNKSMPTAQRGPFTKFISKAQDDRRSGRIPSLTAAILANGPRYVGDAIWSAAMRRAGEKAATAPAQQQRHLRIQTRLAQLLRQQKEAHDAAMHRAREKAAAPLTVGPLLLAAQKQKHQQLQLQQAERQRQEKEAHAQQRHSLHLHVQIQLAQLQRQEKEAHDAAMRRAREKAAAPLTVGPLLLAAQQQKQQQLQLQQAQLQRQQKEAHDAAKQQKQQQLQLQPQVPAIIDGNEKKTENTQPLRKSKYDGGGEA